MNSRDDLQLPEIEREAWKQFDQDAYWREFTMNLYDQCMQIRSPYSSIPIFNHLSYERLHHFLFKCAFSPSFEEIKEV